MTEREKIMQDMERVAFPIYKPNSKDIMVLGALYDAGYRKEEEVQKETAKKFLKMLYDMGVDRQTVETCGLYDVNGSALARFVSQEFGVEVDE